MSHNGLTVDLAADRVEWDATVNQFGGHPLQLWGWAVAKSRGAWRVSRYLVSDGDELIGGAQILVRPLPYPFRGLAYAPRGPFAAEGRDADVLRAIAERVRTDHSAVALSIEPDIEAGSDAEYDLRSVRGLVRGSSPILIPETLVIDLTQTEKELLKDMASKTRYYVRKSGKEGLRYRAIEPAELGQVLEIYRETAERADFGIHTDAYYRNLIQDLREHNTIFGAFDDESGSEQLVAFIWVAHSARTAFDLYGGSNDVGRRRNANYALKWHGLLHMKERGVTRYDVNGLLNDGVSHFKAGFASHRDTLTGTWDLPLSPMYPAYAKAMPLARRAAKRAVPATREALTAVVREPVPTAKRLAQRGTEAGRSLVERVRRR